MLLASGAVIVPALVPAASYATPSLTSALNFSSELELTEKPASHPILRSHSGRVLLRISYHPPELVFIKTLVVIASDLDHSVDAKLGLPIADVRFAGGELALVHGPIVFHAGGARITGVLAAPNRVRLQQLEAWTRAGSF